MVQKTRSHVVDGRAHIVCPKCGKGMYGKVNKKTKSRSIVRCSACSGKFEVQLDYRQQYRKSASFAGNGTCARIGSFPVTIENMSKTGVRFQVCKRKCNLHIGETVSLRFQLDDRNCSDIQVSVKICNSNGTMYGGVFMEEYLSVKVNKAIGFWLL